LSMAGSSSLVSSAAVSSSPHTATSTTAVVGAGVLGTSLCRQILSDLDLAQMTVTGITKTTNRHVAIRDQVLSVDGAPADRFDVRLSDEFSIDGDDKFDNVVFCAPPSGFVDYPQAVKEAAKKFWKGPTSGGVFLFTSSGAVYTQNSGVVTESTPVAKFTDVRETNPRIARLLGAEEACVAAGGSVLRLSGLYSLQRGAHNYWLTSGKDIAGSPDGLVNQLHYDDAAGACLAAIKAGPTKCTGKVFILSDSNPLSRLQICQSTLKAAVYKDFQMPTFTTAATGELVGKTYDCSETYSQLNWKPKYECFDAFMSANA